MKHWKKTVPISCWEGLESSLKKKATSKNDIWIFRGQRRSCWGLKTSLERTLRDRWGLDESSDMDKACHRNEAPAVEEKLKIEFERRYHHFEGVAPETDEYVEWFALMQHYGAPTRLLDWTYSPYVAAFNALEKLDLKKGCAIWAINSSWLDRKFK